MRKSFKSSRFVIFSIKRLTLFSPDKFKPITNLFHQPPIHHFLGVINRCFTMAGNQHLYISDMIDTRNGFPPVPRQRAERPWPGGA
jgi:hypothetical protein